MPFLSLVRRPRCPQGQTHTSAHVLAVIALQLSPVLFGVAVRILRPVVIYDDRHRVLVYPSIGQALAPPSLHLGLPRRTTFPARILISELVIRQRIIAVVKHGGRLCRLVAFALQVIIIITIVNIIIVKTK